MGLRAHIYVNSVFDGCSNGGISARAPESPS